MSSTRRAPSWKGVAERLTKLLHLSVPPIAITFANEIPTGIDRYKEPFAEEAADGRTGRVPAGCVFWMKAADRTFATVPEDHGNCSVGSLTHGLLTLEEASARNDIATLVKSSWVDPAMFSHVPVVSKKPKSIVYGPLAESHVDPDVILVRMAGAALMTLSDALPDLAIEGKPQCHIIAIAKEQQRVAASVGCALSRARTGMKPTEMTCAIPAPKAFDVISALEHTSEVNTTVGRYARRDMKRFKEADV